MNRLVNVTSESREPTAAGDVSSADPERDEQGIKDFVPHFGALMSASGMPGLTGYVFALLLAQPTAQLTAQESGEALDVSPAAVSGATKYLTNIGFTHKLRTPGSRRIVHALNSDDWYLSTLKRNNVVEASQQLFLQGARAAGGLDTPAGRRLWLNAQLFIRLEKMMHEALDSWPEERKALLAGLEAGPVSDPASSDAAHPDTGGDDARGTPGVTDADH